MKPETELYTQTTRSAAVEVVSQRLNTEKTLTTVLLQTEENGRLYYSFAAVLCPVEIPSEDICIVHDVTGNPEDANHIFRLLTEGSVTPCTLEDVLSDLL